MIEIENLTKQFATRDGMFTAVDDLSLTVGSGEIFGFLGPNGAGKTTTVRMLACLLRPSAGLARINGFSVGEGDQEIRRRIGLLTETPGLYDNLSAEKNLTLFGRFYGRRDAASRAHHYLKMLGLWDRRSAPVGSFSKGMRQKLAIARAALHDPEVLFLDEPTSGLDPDIAKLVRDFVLELKAEGRTIFLCTHNLDEADRLCDRVGIFKTRLLVVDSAANLRKQLFGRQQVFQLNYVDADWVKSIYELPFVSEASAEGNRIFLRVANPEEHNPVIVKFLVDLGAEIQYVTEMAHSLEEIYLQVLDKAADN